MVRENTGALIMSPERQKMVIFSRSRRLSDWSAAGRGMPDNAKLIEPVWYPDMLMAMGGAGEMLADYWGVQEGGWLCAMGAVWCSEGWGGVGLDCGGWVGCAGGWVECYRA